MQESAGRPLISIIIPTYNGGPLLAETLRSVMAQDYPRTEIVVVDDGSEEDPAEIIAEIQGDVRLIRQRQSGPGAARNTGVRESSGEYIAFCDHDDLWAPGKLTAQAQWLDGNPNCALVYSYPVLIDGSGRVIENTAPDAFPTGSVFREFLERNRITTFSATLIRRSHFLDIGGIDPSSDLKTCDDYDLWLRLAYRYDVAFCPGDIVFYRVHAGNLVKNYEMNMNAHVKVIEKCRHMLEADGGPAHRRRFERAMRRNLAAGHRKFAFIFYYHYPRHRLESRKAFAKVLLSTPMDIKCALHFLLTFWPFHLLRRVKRALVGARQTSAEVET